MAQILRGITQGCFFEVRMIADHI